MWIRRHRGDLEGWYCGGRACHPPKQPADQAPPQPPAMAPNVLEIVSARPPESAPYRILDVITRRQPQTTASVPSLQDQRRRDVSRAYAIAQPYVPASKTPTSDPWEHAEAGLLRGRQFFGPQCTAVVVCGDGTVIEPQYRNRRLSNPAHSTASFPGSCVVDTASSRSSRTNRRLDLSSNHLTRPQNSAQHLDATCNVVSGGQENAIFRVHTTGKRSGSIWHPAPPAVATVSTQPPPCSKVSPECRAIAHPHVKCTPDTESYRR